MYKYFLSLVFFLLCFNAFSQQLLFTNASKNKVIKAGVGNMVYLTYRGYNGQHEFATNVISEISDSTVTLGLDPSGFMSGKRYNAAANSYKIIYLKDITAFRRRSVAGVVVNSLVSVGGVVGSVFLLNDLIAANNISTGNALLISVGAGLLVKFGTQLIFPVNAKYKMRDGWNVRVVNDID